MTRDLRPRGRRRPSPVSSLVSAVRAARWSSRTISRGICSPATDGVAAIGRRLEELPATARALVVAEVADKEEEQRFTGRASVEVTWLHRNGSGTTSLLEDAIAALRIPLGEGYAWVAAEAATAKALRQHLVEERGLEKERVKAAAYWKRGAIAVHETYND